MTSPFEVDAVMATAQTTKGYLLLLRVDFNALSLTLVFLVVTTIAAFLDATRIVEPGAFPAIFGRTAALNTVVVGRARCDAATGLAAVVLLIAAAAAFF